MTQPPTSATHAGHTAHTPGPWGWFGNQHGLYLATPDRGRRYIMGFRRQGLQGAQPTFQERSVMVPASELVKFAVGDGTARGMAEGRADPSVYRYDIREIDHPDARLIAAAPDLLEAAKDALAGWRYIREHHGDLYGVGWDRVEGALTAALSRATGAA